MLKVTRKWRHEIHGLNIFKVDDKKTLTKLKSNDSFVIFISDIFNFKRA